MPLKLLNLNAFQMITFTQNLNLTYATVTPFSYKGPSGRSDGRTILAKLSGSYRVHVVVMGSTWLLQGLCPALFAKIALHGGYKRELFEGMAVALIIFLWFYFL